jgi:3-(3-hydroxy-phenyl)propionate hydroxylase
MTRLYPLISRWTGNIPAGELEVVRAAEYTFRAQVADRWRDRRVFLLGDAAHLTPPFIGQGMCAALRDGMNLAWKLAGVLDGSLPETVLGTYQIERKHHARAMIKLAKVIGTAMTAGGRVGDIIRRAVAPRLHLVPGLTDLATDSETPALRRSALVLRPRLRRALAGRLCPNAILDGERRLDDVAAGRFAIVTSTEPPATLQADVERCGAVFITARPGSELHRWLRNGRAHAAIVRARRHRPQCRPRPVRVLHHPARLQWEPLPPHDQHRRVARQTSAVCQGYGPSRAWHDVTARPDRPRTTTGWSGRRLVTALDSA